MSESYSSSADPPEESIPMCTLKVRPVQPLSRPYIGPYLDPYLAPYLKHTHVHSQGAPCAALI